MIRYSGYVVAIPSSNVNIKTFDQNNAFKLAQQMANQFNQPINISKQTVENDSVTLSTKLLTISPK